MTDGVAGPAPWSHRGATSGQPTPWVALVVLMALAVVLRAIGLNGGLWWDEIRTLLESVRPPLVQIVTVFPGNNQHTLYSVLAHLSVGVFGDDAWSLRLPALVFGVATVPALFMLAREFTGRAEALLACLFLTVNYHHVWFSQNARGYTLLAFLVVVSTALLLRGLRRGKSSDYAWYAVAAALGVYTHLTMIFVVIGQALACVLLLGLPGFDAQALRRWRQPATGFALSALFTLVLYAPLLFDVQQFFLKESTGAQVATPAWAAMEMLRGLSIGFGTAFGALAGAVLMACGVASYFRQSRFLLALFVLPGAITVGVALALGRPIFPRFLFFVVGFGILILVRGALVIGAWLTQRWHPGVASSDVTPAGATLVVVIAVLSATSLADNYRFPKQDFGGALQFVLAHRGEGEPVVTAGLAGYPYHDYYRQAWPTIASRDDLQKARAQGKPVWVLYTLADYLEAKVPDLMQTLRDECRVAAVLRGTVANGNVTVCVVSAIDAAPTAREK